MTFNAEQYWADKEHKVWVVSLTSTRRVGRVKVRDHHRMYIRARTSAGAIRTAKYHTCMQGRLSGSCRLATPEDLGCVPSPTPRAAGVAA